ncbi:hypothetical protein RHMOL_Rhmol04G0249600 [Rhododendron molle]|uniref:Uncharacterized protein n=1 Tax=Rhododendron molle TaxID=49168 RepID=A0ACC0P5A5_RHOML|nr:hypothetical protein RHMOL_Rhmol04G0249600 [Rhododendron molle]
MQSVNRGNFVKVIGGSEALDAVTIPVVETYLPKVTEGVIIESDSEGEELNVTSDIPFEVKVAVGELSSSVEVDLVSPPHVTDPAATVDFPSQPVLPEEAVPPDDKADAVKGMLAFQSPQELKSHNNKGKGDVLCIVYLLVSVLLHSASVLFCSALELFSGCYSAFELIRTCCNLLKTPFDVLLCPAAVLIKVEDAGVQDVLKLAIMGFCLHNVQILKIILNIGGSEALDAVTIPVVAVVDTAIPTVTEGVTHESESDGEELNVSPDIPLEVKEAAGALSSSGEVDSVRPPHEPDPVVTGVVPSQPVLIVKPVPPDDKAATVQGNVALQSPHEFCSTSEA